MLMIQRRKGRRNPNVPPARARRKPAEPLLPDSSRRLDHRKKQADHHEKCETRCDHHARSLIWLIGKQSDCLYTEYANNGDFGWISVSDGTRRPTGVSKGLRYRELSGHFLRRRHSGLHTPRLTLNAPDRKSTRLPVTWPYLVCRL